MSSNVERDAVEYFKSILLRKGEVNVHKLRGHLGQASDKMCELFRTKYSGYKFIKFFKRHPECFRVLPSDIVMLKDCYKRQPESSNESSESSTDSESSTHSESSTDNSESSTYKSISNEKQSEASTNDTICDKQQPEFSNDKSNYDGEQFKPSNNNSHSDKVQFESSSDYNKSPEPKICRTLEDIITLPYVVRKNKIVIDEHLASSHILLFTAGLLSKYDTVHLSTIVDYYEYLPQSVKNYIETLSGQTKDKKFKSFFRKYAMMINLSPSGCLTFNVDSGHYIFVIFVLETVRTLLIDEVNKGCSDIAELIQKLNESCHTMPESSYWKEMGVKDLLHYFTIFKDTFFVPGDGSVYLMNIDVSDNPYSENVIEFFCDEAKNHGLPFYYTELSAYLASKKPKLYAKMKQWDSFDLCTILWQREDLFYFKNECFYLRNLSSDDEQRNSTHINDIIVMKEVDETLLNLKGSVDWVTEALGYISATCKSNTNENVQIGVLFTHNTVGCDCKFEDLRLHFKSNQQVVFNAIYTELSFHKTLGNGFWVAVKILSENSSQSGDQELELSQKSSKETNTAANITLPQILSSESFQNQLISNELVQHLFETSPYVKDFVKALTTALQNLIVGKVSYVHSNYGVIKPFIATGSYIYFAKESLQTSEKNVSNMREVCRADDIVLCYVSEVLTDNLSFASFVIRLLPPSFKEKIE